MRAGLLRERLEFQAKTQTISGPGDTTAAWPTAFTAWGRVKQEDGRASENAVGDRPLSQTAVTMIVRYDARIVTGMRVAWRSRVFEIEGVLNRDERRKSLDLVMIERKSP